MILRRRMYVLRTHIYTLQEKTHKNTCKHLPLSISIPSWLTTHAIIRLFSDYETSQAKIQKRCYNRNFRKNRRNVWKTKQPWHPENVPIEIREKLKTSQSNFLKTMWNRKSWKNHLSSVRIKTQKSRRENSKTFIWKMGMDNKRGRESVHQNVSNDQKAPRRMWPNSRTGRAAKMCLQLPSAWTTTYGRKHACRKRRSTL